MNEQLDELKQFGHLADELSVVYDTMDKTRVAVGRVGVGANDFPQGSDNARAAWHKLVPSIATAGRLRALLEFVAADPNAQGRRDKFLPYLASTSVAIGVRPDLSPQELAAVLLERTILRGDADASSRASTATKLMRLLTNEHKLSGAMLVDATRFAIECQLLFAQELTAETMFEILTDSRFTRAVEYGKENGFDGILVRVEPQLFFMRTRAREDDWRNYFDVVPSALKRLRARSSTLCIIRSPGFILPQFLVAGLLSQFADDWGRVLRVYGAQTTENSAFGRLQASQWNTWLMWGPSIPICTCEEWQNVHALQYGYGDETNSLPLTGTDERGMLASLDGTNVFEETACGSPRKVSARLRWAPWVFHPYGRRIDESVSVDNWNEENAKLNAARAQRLIYGERGRPEPTRGLLLQAIPHTELKSADNSAHWYYSAYQWLMFLVARRPIDGATPTRISGDFPPFFAPRVHRFGERLWRELLPVFVHANVADEAALDMQRSALVESAVSLLRRVWDERETLLPGHASALGFWLVSASDYSGCGHPLRFPPTDSLAARLETRLRECSDKAFVQAVVLPNPQRPSGVRSSQLARFYSACHLPELITDYYEYIDKLSEG